MLSQSVDESALRQIVVHTFVRESTFDFFSTEIADTFSIDPFTLWIINNLHSDVL